MKVEEERVELKEGWVGVEGGRVEEDVSYEKYNPGLVGEGLVHRPVKEDDRLVDSAEEVELTLGRGFFFLRGVLAMIGTEEIGKKVTID